MDPNGPGPELDNIISGSCFSHHYFDFYKSVYFLNIFLVQKQHQQNVPEFKSKSRKTHKMNTFY